MRRAVGRPGLAVLAGTMVAAAPVMAACDTGPSYEEWAATDGAAGRINLDEVQQAFKESKDASEFERRVNEIYEGDGIVLIRARQSQAGLDLEAYEDLNGNGRIDEDTDDQLFSIFKDNENRHQMRGYGANGYYHSGFGAGNFLFTYLLISSLSPRGYYYATPPASYASMRRDRDNYRASSAYRSQVSRNTTYFNNNRSSFADSKYGANRQSYLNTQKRTSAFKTNSRTGVRSSWGTGGSGSSFGKSATARSSGFLGGGGGRARVGRRRERRRI